MGIYIFTAFNSSLGLNNYTISISGKDKMCLLNGEIAGNLHTSIDFGKDEYVDLETNTITYTQIPIKDIIRNAVHVYGGEDLSKIIINDLDIFGAELLEYRGDESTPLYMLREVTGTSYQMTLNGKQQCYYTDSDAETKLDSIEQYDNLVDIIQTGAPYAQGSVIVLKANDPNAKKYTVAKITYGQAAGYRQTDLVYAGDLIAAIGETLTSVLDKIVKMLGDFEYFYDVDGRFIFQRKKVYIQQTWNNLVKQNSDIYASSTAYSSAAAYTFQDNKLFSALSNNPALANVRNDFSIWGTRKSATGTKLPVHLRFAIDDKPIYYKAFDGQIYITKDSPYQIKNAIIEDWREIIYQMAIDYYQHNEEDDFLASITANNKFIYQGESINLFPSGKTGYEIYYDDIEGFWREIYTYYNRASGYEEIRNKVNELYKQEKNKYRLLTSDEKTTLNQIIGYYEVMQNNLPYSKEYAVAQEEYEKLGGGTVLSRNYYLPKTAPANPWEPIVSEHPENLNFWFDFLDLDASPEVEKFSVKNIGDRPKVVNDNTVTAIYYKQVPTVLFITKEEYDQIASPLEGLQTGYTYIRINPTLNNFFHISSQGKSAWNLMEELLYQHTYATEVVSITAVPIYYLQPNTRICLKATDNNVEGEYLVSRITIPLSYNGMMTINATKAADRIY